MGSLGRGEHLFKASGLSAGILRAFWGFDTALKQSSRLRGMSNLMKPGEYRLSFRILSEVPN